MRKGKSVIHPPIILFKGFDRLPSSIIKPNTTGVLSIEMEVDPYDKLRSRGL